jgi:hypothetical protein
MQTIDRRKSRIGIAESVAKSSEAANTFAGAAQKYAELNTTLTIRIEKLECEIKNLNGFTLVFQLRFV